MTDLQLHDIRLDQDDYNVYLYCMTCLDYLHDGDEVDTLKQANEWATQHIKENT